MILKNKNDILFIVTYLLGGIRMKKIIIVSIFIVLTTAGAFAQSIISDKEKVINDAAVSFMEDFSASVINAATNQNVYADAYIGKVFPSIPPHFAVGINTSIAELKLGELSKATEEINGIVTSLNSALGENALGIKTLPASAILPFFTADARIGGLFLPFDLGVSVMKTPKLDFYGVKLDYFTFGADVRYAVLQENLILPNVSLGASYYYTKGSIAADQDVASFTFNNEMNIVALSAQVSKNFIIVTPFVGGRFAMAQAKNNFDWDVSVAGVGVNGTPTYNKDFAEITSTNVYAGLSFNILILKLTPSVSYDFNNQLLTGAFSIRAQL